MSMKSTTIIQVEDNQSMLDRLQNSGSPFGVKRSPTVEALYDLCFKKDGVKLCMHKGERYKLLKKANQDWWLVEKLPSKLATKFKLVANDCECALGHDDEIKDSITFYAPANYLKEVELIERVPSPKLEKSELFLNSLDSEFSCDSGDDADSGNHDDVEISSNIAATSSRESLIDESSEWKQDCDSPENKTETSNNSRPDSPPIYANLPLVCKKSAPVPGAGIKPVRILLNHWAEYVHRTGRKYYYNSLSRESSWKPPRRKLSNLDDEVTSHSEENLTDSSTTSLSTSTSKDNSLSRSDCSPEPLTRGSRLRANMRLSREPSEKKDEDLRSMPTLTGGWTRHVDKSNEIYFVNDKTKGKWFCKVDENGRLYFFEENGTESYWELPDLSDGQSADDPGDKGEASSTASDPNVDRCTSEEQPQLRRILRPAPTLPSTLLQANRLTSLERSVKAKSMAFLPITDRLASNPIIPVALLHTEGKNEATKSTQFPPEPPATLQDAKVIRSGNLNRTKMMENGRRTRKNWSICFVALTDYYLMVFKETKLITGSLKPEMTIELSGALIEWSRKSSRKNVFEVTTVSGQQILLQDDCPLTSKAWFDAIRCAIFKLPSIFVSQELNDNETDGSKECKLKRSKSSKQYRKNESKDFGQVLANIPPDKKKKIKDRLKLFLRRRPTLESIRDKGIYKDEPVFGCNLCSLCQSEKQNVPRFVKECIEAIEKKDLKADGIYRACGNLSQVQRIRYQVNHDNYNGIWTEDDVHVLTGALKLFFRDMQEPLFPCSLFDPLMDAIGLSDRHKKFEAIKTIVAELAKPNYETLKYLLEHLLRVKDYSDENRMHIQNLAIVFGPTLMRPENDSNNFAYDMMLRMHSNQAIEFLLLEFENIFS